VAASRFFCLDRQLVGDTITGFHLDLVEQRLAGTFRTTFNRVWHRRDGFASDNPSVAAPNTVGKLPWVELVGTGGNHKVTCQYSSLRSMKLRIIGWNRVRDRQAAAQHKQGPGIGGMYTWHRSCTQAGEQPGATDDAHKVFWGPVFSICRAASWI